VSTRPERAQGYTLLEMIVVLALIGLILSATLPLSLRGTQSRRLDEQAKLITTILKTARMEAVLKNMERAVETDFRKNLVRIKDGREQLVLDSTLTVKMLTARNEVKGDRGAIRFFPNGSSTGGALILQRGARSVEIRVDWLTGKISRIE
jgi:general secretion pathway protein H